MTIDIGTTQALWARTSVTKSRCRRRTNGKIFDAIFRSCNQLYKAVCTTFISRTFSILVGPKKICSQTDRPNNRWTETPSCRFPFVWTNNGELVKQRETSAKRRFAERRALQQKSALLGLTRPSRPTMGPWVF